MGWSLGSNYSTTAGKIAINNGKNNKFIKQEELEKYSEQGWIKGFKMSDKLHGKGCKSSVFGKIKINDGKIEKYANKNDLNHFLINGWKVGRIK